jgi:hypothetical protein
VTRTCGLSLVKADRNYAPVTAWFLLVIQFYVICARWSQASRQNYPELCLSESADGNQAETKMQKSGEVA